MHAGYIYADCLVHFEHLLLVTAADWLGNKTVEVDVDLETVVAEAVLQTAATLLLLVRAMFIDSVIANWT